MLSILAVTTLSAVSALAQQSGASSTLSASPTISSLPATPLASKHFTYPSGIPYQADTDANLLRGPQQGYNLCNSSTEGVNSMCQTGFMDHLDDFCLWAPSKPNSTIADTEGEEVAWCSQPGRGTRIIPPGAITGIQYMKTADYIQVVGYIDQSKININSADYGGELDPHGADLRGNPLGGLLFSNAFPSTNTDNNTFTQVIEWHNFMGGGMFCMKACDPAGANAANYCQHVFDRIGLAYNCPSNPKNGTFEACLGEDQDFPGVYTSNGQVVTYTQPDESLGPITTMPYTPRVPASSSCTPFASSALYSSAAQWYAKNVPTTSSSGKGASATASSTRSGTGSSSTGKSSGAVARVTVDTGMGSAVVIGMMGMLFATMFLA